LEILSNVNLVIINKTTSVSNGIHNIILSPSNIRNTNKIWCLECINSKLGWYLNPICQTDYIKFIGNPNETFYSMKREINDIELSNYKYISL